MYRYTTIAACAALFTSCEFSAPNFYRMSETELAAYNAALPPLEQVACVTLKASPDKAEERICGTPAEIENSLVPAAGAQQPQAMPVFRVIPESRSTNPAQGPSAINPPAN